MIDIEHRPLLRVRGLTKTFPGLRALDDVALDVTAGEIIGLVGHNGSGKSTLAKVLAGVHTPDQGGALEIRAHAGELVPLHPPNSDLHFIHLNLGLVESLSTIENLDLGKRHTRLGLLPSNRRREAVQARVLERTDLVSATDGRVRAQRTLTGEIVELGPVAALVLAQSRLPETSLLVAARRRSTEVLVVGDAYSPRNAMMAFTHGDVIARQI